jgi:transposase
MWSRGWRVHPLRQIRRLANAALSALDAYFKALPTPFGRPSIPPERLLAGNAVQAFYGVRSERQLIERIEFDLLFRWFVGLGIDEAVRDHSSFSNNRDRLLSGELAAKLLRAIFGSAEGKAADLKRTFLSVRNANRGMGFDQELSPQGWERR